MIIVKRVEGRIKRRAKISDHGNPLLIQPHNFLFLEMPLQLRASLFRAGMRRKAS